MLRILSLFVEGFVEGFEAEYLRLSSLRQTLEQHHEQDNDNDSLELEEEELSDQLILEIVERAHERFASRLDALDTVLVGLMAAILAIGAIAIDKYTQLKPCMPFFVSSLACCAIGWALGSVVCRVREPVDPGYVLVGARERGREAVYELAIAIATTYKRRQWLRLAKVAAVAIAMILLFVGIVAALNAESVVK